MRRLATATLAALVTVGPLGAQDHGAARDWTLEAAGGTLGSAAGFGLGVALSDDDCGDDLGCVFENVAGVLATASAGATLGAWALGRAAGSEPSLGGAALGSLAGAALGLGAIEVLDEIDPRLDEGAVAVVGFALTQGVVTALGSRIGKALR